MSNRIHSNALLLGCMFVGNSTISDGGGLANLGASATLINCLFTGNSAKRHGGGVYNWGTINASTFSTMINCTVAGNSADSFGNGVGDGGGIFDHEYSTSAVTNTVLWGNSDSGPLDESAQIHSLDNDPIINHSCLQGWTGALGGIGNFGDDPLFVDADGADDIPGTQDDDLRLLPGSPAVDAASNEAVPNNVTTDLDGNPRFVDDQEMPDCPQAPDTCGDCPVADMGAYEAQAGSTQCCGDCATDANDDGQTGPFDLAALLAAWGSCDTGDPCECLDADSDGDIDPFDLATLLSSWGPCP